MRTRGEFLGISLEAGWRRAAMAALALAAVGPLALAGARHAAAQWLAQGDDPRQLRRALAFDPENTELLRRAGRQALASLDLPLAEHFYHQALASNRFDAPGWVEYSFVSEAEGKLEQAQAAMLRAVDLAPASAELLLAAGNFFARRADWGTALDYFRRAVSRDAGATPAVLETCWRGLPDREQILSRALPENRTAYEVYLQFLWSRSEWQEAGRVWAWTVEHGLAPGSKVSFAYVDALVGARRHREALRVWQTFAGSSGNSGNLIHNASFHQPLLNGGFDWLYAPAPGVDLAYDQSGDGVRAVALRFGGLDNADTWPLRQVVPVEPATSYRLEAWVKADAITSTSGPRLEVRDSYSGKVLAWSEPVTGSLGWQKRAVEFRTPPETELVTIGIRRPAAPPWDEPISGTLWLRDFSMRPAPASLASATTAETRP